MQSTFDIELSFDKQIFEDFCSSECCFFFVSGISLYIPFGLYDSLVITLIFSFDSPTKVQLFSMVLLIFFSNISFFFALHSQIKETLQIVHSKKAEEWIR